VVYRRSQRTKKVDGVLLQDYDRCSEVHGNFNLFREELRRGDLSLRSSGHLNRAVELRLIIGRLVFIAVAAGVLYLWLKTPKTLGFSW
jgi:hypothetical protein